MKIVHVNFPIVYTDSGKEISIASIIGHPKVGADLVAQGDGSYVISAITSDSECVGGVCPVR